MLSNLTWVCHVCKEERPDEKISVLTKPLIIGSVEVTQNIRYCNDRPECFEGAKVFSFADPAQAAPKGDPLGRPCEALKGEVDQMS